MADFAAPSTQGASSLVRLGDGATFSVRDFLLWLTEQGGSPDDIERLSAPERLEVVCQFADDLDLAQEELAAEPGVDHDTWKTDLWIDTLKAAAYRDLADPPAGLAGPETEASKVARLQAAMNSVAPPSGDVDPNRIRTDSRLDAALVRHALRSGVADRQDVRATYARSLLRGLARNARTDRLVDAEAAFGRAPAMRLNDLDGARSARPACLAGADRNPEFATARRAGAETAFLHQIVVLTLRQASTTTILADPDLSPFASH